jgi:glycosyltransferase involved in cell wall biosynthesis
MLYIHNTMKHPTLVLNMIVKNEAPIIGAFLENVRPLIDSWAIMDTGSDDGTVEIIQKTMNGIPGRLESMEWIGFAKSRNAAIEMAHGMGDYLLFLDADDRPVWAGEVDAIKRQLTHSLHYGTLTEGQSKYTRLVFMKNGANSRYRGVIHEVLIPERGEDIGAIVQDFAIERGTIGVSNRSTRGKDKFRNDIELLEAALLDGTDVDFTERYRFYLAQSYRDCGEIQKAIENYQIRYNMPGGYQQERYVAAMNVGQLLTNIRAPISEILLKYFQAREIDPFRSEAFHRVAELARRNNMWRLAFDNAVRARDTATPSDRLFIDTSVAQWRALFEISVSAWYVGDIEEGRKACLSLLDSPHTPKKIKDLTTRNLVHYPL